MGALGSSNAAAAPCAFWPTSRWAALACQAPPRRHCHALMPRQRLSTPRPAVAECEYRKEIYGGAGGAAVAAAAAAGGPVLSVQTMPPHVAADPIVALAAVSKAAAGAGESVGLAQVGAAQAARLGRRRGDEQLAETAPLGPKGAACTANAACDVWCCLQLALQLQGPSAQRPPPAGCAACRQLHWMPGRPPGR